MSINRRIEILVNGLNESVPEHSSISQLIRLFIEKDTHLIVEHNGRFVYPRQYKTLLVSEGDRIEFINPNFGG